MKNLMVMVCLLTFVVVGAQEELTKEELICHEFLQEQIQQDFGKEVFQAQEAALIQQEQRVITKQSFSEQEIFREGRGLEDLCKAIFEPEIDIREPLLDDFAPPEQQVFEQEQLDSFFSSTTAQNEQEFTDVRIKKLSKMDFIERRVIERSFDSFLKKQLEANLTAEKKSVFKRLTAEIRKINKDKNTRIVKKNENTKVVQAEQNK